MSRWFFVSLYVLDEDQDDQHQVDDEVQFDEEQVDDKDQVNREKVDEEQVDEEQVKYLAIVFVILFKNKFERNWYFMDLTSH